MTPPPATGRLGDTIIAPLQPPADVHLDDTSDNMLKSLTGFHDKMTGKLGGLYARWIGHPSRNLAIQFAAPYGQGDEENRLLGELGGFGFGYFWGAQGRAANLGKAAKSAQDASGQVKQDLSAAWQGKAADSAGEKTDDLNKVLGDYSGTVNGFSQLLQNLWHTVRPPIADLAKLPDAPGQAPKIFVDAHNPDDCDGLSMFIDRLDDAIKWGRQNTNVQWDIATVWGDNRSTSEVAKSQEDGTGPIAPQDLRNMSVDLDVHFDSKWSNDLIRQMDEYSAQYSDAMTTFRQAIRNAHTAATNALRAFSDGLNVPTDPFGSLHLGASPDTGGGTKTSSSGGPRSGSGGPSSGGGGGMTAPSAAAPQPTPAVTPPAATDPNLNPVTHQSLEVDPATGQPYPIDPKTGEAIKSDATEPETVTVEQGGNKISMSEPDDNGKMGITVDEGTGQEKQYQLDFGDDPAPSQASDPDFGPQGHDGAQDASGQSDAGRHQAPQPDGAPTAADGTATSGQVYQPGPDGKIHIDDGNLKITAERPDGADGPTVVTVDDGSGQPTKYTLDDDGDLHPAAADGQPVGNLAQPAAAQHADVPDQTSPIDHATPVGHGASDQTGPVDHSGAVDQSAAHDPTDAGAPTGRHHASPDVGMPADTMDATAASADQPSVDDSTTAQSLTDPTDSHSGLGPGFDDGLGQTSEPADWQGGGGATAPASGDLGTAPTTTDQQGQPMAMMGGGMMGGGGLGNTGGDQERGANPYRSGLFESTPSGRRISGSLLDDED
ncbi:hypothetical protein [Amycolatopsis sp. DSM 110486]|uniref:hypothetical protein n=1 Tax=Amycolatopsis sp. DSM 110486 TaxID=2865832 RepID=UPI001C698101|nr:hypothetical protein [Amycolatopsis sp. DSM 110486]QYN24901.1 hypothetical protein K1T34_22160 [Amycolatopsis sp. DSM 110486]